MTGPGPRLEIRIDQGELVRLLASGRDAVARFVGELATDLAVNVADEARGASSRLAEPWPVEGSGPAERRVVAPPDAWFAHFLARGTKAHGPRTAARLVFAADGLLVFAMFVSGVSANPFDERAIRVTETRADSILERLIEAAI